MTSRMPPSTCWTSPLTTRAPTSASYIAPSATTTTFRKELSWARWSTWRWWLKVRWYHLKGHWGLSLWDLLEIFLESQLLTSSESCHRFPLNLQRCCSWALWWWIRSWEFSASRKTTSISSQSSFINFHFARQTLWRLWGDVSWRKT